MDRIQGRMRENTYQRKPAYLDILLSVTHSLISPKAYTLMNKNNRHYAVVSLEYCLSLTFVNFNYVNEIRREQRKQYNNLINSNVCRLQSTKKFQTSFLQVA